MNNSITEQTWRWVVGGVTAGSAVTSLGFSLAALGSQGVGNRYVLYNLSRSGAIVVATGVACVAARRSAAGVTVVGVLMTVVQALDAGVGLVINDPVKTYGPAGLALVSALALTGLRRSRRAGGSRSADNLPHHVC